MSWDSNQDQLWDLHRNEDLDIPELCLLAKSKSQQLGSDFPNVSKVERVLFSMRAGLCDDIA